MIRTIKRISSSIFLVLLVASLSAGQVREFDQASLTSQGREAYQGLLGIKLFAIGNIGYGGTKSSGEKFLDVLIEEKSAVAAFKQLVTDGTIEGGFYGLFGLGMLNCECFEGELARYSLLRFSSEGKDPFTTQAGCLRMEAINLEDKRMILDFYIAKGYLKNKAQMKECERKFNGRPGDRVTCENEVLKQQ